MEEILKNISQKDLEKLRMLLSILPSVEQKEVITLRIFMEEYLSYVKSNRSLSYYKSAKIAFNHFIKFLSLKNDRPGLQISVQSLKQKDIENFITYLQQKVKRGYVVYYRNLKASFNKAKEWGYVYENYFTRVKLPKRQKLAPAFIDSDQLSAISDQIRNDVVRDVVLLAFHTGLRLAEIVNLRWKNVDVENRIITVGDENFITKGRKQRFIPISEEALDVLLRMKNAECRVQNEKRNRIISIKSLDFAQGFVFCKEDGSRFTGNYFSRRFKEACRTAVLNKAIHFHSLRHSFASNLAQKGVPLYTIKELLGHSSISTTEIYSHLNLETLREAVEKLNVKSKTGEEPPLSFGHLPPESSPGQALSKEEKTQAKIFRINVGEKQ